MIVYLLLSACFFLPLGATKQQLCINNAHVSGSWKYNEVMARGRKSFLCCGYDDSDYQWNILLCGNETLDGKTSSLYQIQTGGHGCSCDRNDDLRISVSRRESYRWEPDTCHIAAWDAAQFCDLLRDRKVVIIGDSLALQIASTVSALVFRRNSKCGQQIVSMRDGFRLQDVYETYGLDAIYLVNFGAHCTVEGERCLHRKWQQLGDQLELDPYKHNRTVVWWTNLGGHENCEDIKEPSSGYIIRNVSEDKYMWYRYPKYDSISKNYVMLYNLTLLDMSPLYLRPDAHSDCMHWCIPGPLNLFAELLLTKLITGEV